MKVDIYFNLHKKCLSIRHKGKVIAHADNAELDNVKFIVSQAGRARVLREKRKNVHAFVRGELVSYGQQLPNEPKDGNVTYNPYKYDSFVRRVDESRISQAQKVFVVGKNICATE